MAELKQLSEQVAETVLSRIAERAPRLSGESLEHLANAYAAVVTNMPRKSARPVSG